ncbi:hypothetical protein AVEN_144049-1 [Araneus ventricosus]|uniref:ATP-dependent DNA helicase n=1 Tax=Araneus ventricosus TaxID=182803 RepID=A0A4Y2DEN9_ARAVE|nr:hypothetical protein AVEN_144049-1 [Araneus ventricosus]
MSIFYNIWRKQMNLDYRKISEQLNEAVMNLITEDKGGILFLDAPGGTGRTFLSNLILVEIRSKRHIALDVASPGITSTLLNAGCTSP